jgi:transposase
MLEVAYFKHVTESIAMSADGPFELHTQALGALPIVSWFLERMRVAALLERHLAATDGRCSLSAARAIGALVRNLCVSREPLYGLGEWAARHDPRVLGLAGCELELLNDDRVGRALERLFDADRASLLTELVLGVICEFSVDCSRLHNDSTSISVHGGYAQADGRELRGKPTVAITHGHSKDHRPDLKQLVVILTVTADGAVPIAHRACDGNTNDAGTHIASWERLVAILGQTGFLYVADCKLVSRAQMDHIDQRSGRFLSVLPRSRRETQRLCQWGRGERPDWSEAARVPAARAGEPDEIWSVAPAPIASTEGYRLIWVHSTLKHKLDQQARRDALTRAIAGLDALAQRLAGPKCRFHRRDAVQHAAETVLAGAGASNLISFEIQERTDRWIREESRGPGRAPARRKCQRLRFQLHWQIDETALAQEAAAYGCFALITNDRQLTDAELLTAYRYQPNLEKRHHQLKSVLAAAPIYLKSPARIEALITCQFIALLTCALIERELRQAMARQNIHHLPIYPEQRASRGPTATRVLDLFADLEHHRLTRDGTTIQHFQPTLTEPHQQLLNLLAIPLSDYSPTDH